MLDIFSIIYLAWGAWRGARRRFYTEFYAVTSLALVFFFSISLFSLIFQVINHVTSFLVSFCLVLVLFFPLRSHLRQQFEAKFGHIASRKAGMVMGIIRVLMILLLLMALISAIPSERIQHFIVGDSGIGSQIQLLHHWLKPQQSPQ